MLLLARPANSLVQAKYAEATAATRASAMGAALLRAGFAFLPAAAAIRLGCDAIIVYRCEQLGQVMMF